MPSTREFIDATVEKLQSRMTEISEHVEHAHQLMPIALRSFQLLSPLIAQTYSKEGQEEKAELLFMTISLICYVERVAKMIEEDDITKECATKALCDSVKEALERVLLQEEE